MQGGKGRRLKSEESDTAPCPMVWARVHAGERTGQAMATESCPRPLEDPPRHCACRQGLPQLPCSHSLGSRRWLHSLLPAYFFMKCPLQMGRFMSTSPLPWHWMASTSFSCISSYMWHFSYSVGPYSLWGNSGIICKSDLLTHGLLSLEQHEKRG